MNTVELIYITPNAAKKIEEIASVCYDSEPTNDFRIFKSCMSSGHMSVAEHSDITFKITCSRACSHQLVRHRTAKFTQRSQRYVNEDNFDYYIPNSIKSNNDAYKIYKTAIDTIRSCYKQLTDIDVPAEDARYVLPNACETTIIMTMDFRNFFHFLNERLCTRAQKEIRDVACDMASLAAEACPVIKPFCVPKCERFDVAFCPERKGCGRHKSLKQIVGGENNV